MLINGSEMRSKLKESSKRFSAQFQCKDKAVIAQSVDELYLATLTRQPTADESRAMVDYIHSAGDACQAFEDVLWVFDQQSRVCDRSLSPCTRMIRVKDQPERVSVRSSSPELYRKIRGDVLSSNHHARLGEIFSLWNGFRQHTKLDPTGKLAAAIDSMRGFNESLSFASKMFSTYFCGLRSMNGNQVLCIWTRLGDQSETYAGCHPD